MLFSRWFGEESNLDLRDFTPALVRISYQTRPTVKGRSRGSPSGEGGDRTRGLRLARAALSQRELHPQRVAFCPRGGTDPERSPATTCLLVHASRVRFELTSNRIKSPAPYRSSHRPNKSRRRDSKTRNLQDMSLTSYPLLHSAAPAAGLEPATCAVIGRRSTR